MAVPNLTRTNPGCDWCHLAGAPGVDAVFVVVTGDLETDEVANWFVCVKHADHICSMRYARRIMISGIAIDLWQLNAINDHAREYHQKCLRGNTK